MDRRDKIIGCILGGAIGDSVGGPYEGKKMPVIIDSKAEGRLSDDTQMTLATCEAISKSGKVDPADIAETFAEWHRRRRFTSLGASTYKALTELVRGGHWALVGRKGEMAAGNGAAMRIAPLAFFLDPKDPQARVTIRDVCRITHHNEEAYAGALAVTLAIRAMWDGILEGEMVLIDHIVDHLPDSSVRDRLGELSKFNEVTPLSEIAEQFGCSGYVVESVPLALYGVQRLKTRGFQGLLEELISVGGDTDTMASIAGQITGTIIGQTGLPKESLSRLPDFEMIIEIAGRFATIAENHKGTKKI